MKNLIAVAHNFIPKRFPISNFVEFRLMFNSLYFGRLKNLSISLFVGQFDGILLWVVYSQINGICSRFRYEFRP